MRYDPGRRPNAPSVMGVRFTPNQLAEMHGSPQYSPNPPQQQQQQQALNSSQPPPPVCSSCASTWSGTNFYQLARTRRRRRVCVCLCVSVCLSHPRIVSKRLNVGSRKQRHVIAQGL